MPDLEHFRHQPELWQDIEALEETAILFIKEDKLVMGSMFLAFVGIKIMREKELYENRSGRQILQPMGKDA